MPLPKIELSGTLYKPDRSYAAADTEMTELEQGSMDMCLLLGEEAIKNGNPPIGAVLIDYDSGHLWAARTVDKTSRYLLDHAELRVYRKARKTVRDMLANCALVTTAEPCATCTLPYAEGQIGRIIFAANRPSIYEVAGIMRPRDINMKQLLIDGKTTTHVIEGYQAEKALSLFGLYGKMHAESDSSIPG